VIFLLDWLWAEISAFLICRRIPRQRRRSQCAPGIASPQTRQNRSARRFHSWGEAASPHELPEARTGKWTAISETDADDPEPSAGLEHRALTKPARGGLCEAVANRLRAVSEQFKQQVMSGG